MRKIKTYIEYINELYTVPISVSGSGKTKTQHLIYDDPTSDKSLSSGVLLNQDLKDKEFLDYINSGIGPGDDKLSVLLNNLKFLKDKKQELGQLYCEYCNDGPLVIYDFTKDSRVPTKINGKIRFNNKFNEDDGATTDHREPQSKGGDKFDYKNLAVCCFSCNKKKRDMSYNEWMRLISKNKVNKTNKSLNENNLLSDAGSNETWLDINDICLELVESGFSAKIHKLTIATPLEGEEQAKILRIQKYPVLIKDTSKRSPFKFEGLLKDTVLRLVDFLDDKLYYVKFYRVDEVDGEIRSHVKFSSINDGLPNEETPDIDLNFDLIRIKFKLEK